jgi:hypothetical protein
MPMTAVERRGPEYAFPIGRKGPGRADLITLISASSHRHGRIAAYASESKASGLNSGAYRWSPRRAVGWSNGEGTRRWPPAGPGEPRLAGVAPGRDPQRSFRGGAHGRPDRERWTKRVADFEASDLTQREFASERGISFSNLRNWIYRLRKLCWWARGRRYSPTRGSEANGHRCLAQPEQGRIRREQLSPSSLRFDFEQNV